jgi:hypothetical protein
MRIRDVKIRIWIKIPDPQHWFFEYNEAFYHFRVRFLAIDLARQNKREDAGQIRIRNSESLL